MTLDAALRVARLHLLAVQQLALAELQADEDVEDADDWQELEMNENSKFRKVQLTCHRHDEEHETGNLESVLDVLRLHLRKKKRKFVKIKNHRGR